MAVHSPPRSSGTGSTSPTGVTRHRARFPVTGWVLGILSAISAFLGAFILLAGDEQSVGLGGQVSWEVGQIDPAWGYGLLAVGVVAGLAALALLIRTRRLPASPAAEHRSGWGDVAAHAAVFLAVNAFLWAQDIALGDGLNYALWITIPWAIGLAAHALTQYTAAHRTSEPSK